MITSKRRLSRQTLKYFVRTTYRTEDRAARRAAIRRDRHAAGRLAWAEIPDPEPPRLRFWACP